jgi:PiT family inorganic phosphate transporter
VPKSPFWSAMACRHSALAVGRPLLTSVCFPALGVGNGCPEHYFQYDDATKYIPDWVKIAVAIALGLGTMVGWRRVVVTIGERIGKQHLSYGQGASAEVVAMATIGAADLFGTPVSTTQVLSSGVAGTMAANGSRLQWGTVRNLLLAWVLTLPAAIFLSGALYVLLRQVF